MAVVIIYCCIASRSLAEHAVRVVRALNHNDLSAAREAVGMVVGRDTAELDESEVTRAGVEAVAESTGDGVLSPLFWAVIAGPVGAVAYRAINTLDSMWGHKDDRYRSFGWAAARADDCANYIPARMGVLMISLAAVVLRMRPIAAVSCAWRDGRQHDSPNAGLGEAAFAGALGVQIGGTNTYDGEVIEGHHFGTPDRPLDVGRLGAAIRLMLMATVCATAIGTAALYCLSLWNPF